MAILFILCPEFTAQCRFFIKNNEEMYTEDRDRGYSDAYWAGGTENDPKSDPTGGRARINRIADIAVTSDNNEPPRCREWCRTPASGPGEIPDTQKSG